MLISSVGLPLTRIYILPPITHAFIQDTHFSTKPILLSIYSKKLNSTESYAFSKSTLRNKHSRFFLFATFTTSLTIITPSTKCLPLRNVDRDLVMTEFITFANLPANTLERRLYKLPNNEIGLNSLRDKGTFTLRISVTKYAKGSRGTLIIMELIQKNLHLIFYKIMKLLKESKIKTIQPRTLVTITILYLHIYFHDRKRLNKKPIIVFEDRSKIYPIQLWSLPLQSRNMTLD